MIPLADLLVPIAASSVLVFIASSIVHMVLTYHRTDMIPFPDEDGVLEALRRFNLPAGDYVAPHVSSSDLFKDPKFVAKMNQGPLVLMNVAPGGPFSMGKNLAQWFVYSVIVSVLSAYIAGRTLPAGTDYMRVFQIVSCAAFMGYSLGLLQQSIWYRRKWMTTMKSVFDGFLYALLTAGVFGWLWPK